MHPPRVKYELQEYERIISSVAGIQARGGVCYDAIGNNIQSEVERIKQTFINEIFGFSDERHLERYVQYHQLALIRLMDEAVSKSNTSKTIARQMYQLCYQGLEDLLVFIEKHFAKYFDQNAKAPEAYITIVKNDISAHINTFQDCLYGRGADVKITQTILYGLRMIIAENSSNEITYRKLLYAKELQRELSKLLSDSDSGVDIKDELRNLMYYLNYNSMEAFNYHKQYIEGVLSEGETRTERIEKLSYLLKRINQAQVKPGISYNFYALGLKAQLNNYITEEINHLQRVHNLTPGLSAVVSAKADLFSSVKIQLEMSVAQIAYLIKLFIDARIIANKNLTELLRFISTFLISKKTEIISYDSLRAKYYNVEQSTKEAVKANLLRMLSLIDKN